MEKEKVYLISDASRKIEVESHVLRYWEDELKLPVKRNALGHRYYTEDDIREFQEIKKLKEKGLQLKAIRMILKNGKLTRLQNRELASEEDLQQIGQMLFSEAEGFGVEGQKAEVSKAEVSKNAESFNAKVYETEIFGTEGSKAEISKAEGTQELEILPVQDNEIVAENEADGKMRRLEYLMKKLISEAVQESNEKFHEEMTETLTKELDYQFRMQEERDEQRENRQLLLEEEHYKQLDALLRGKSVPKRAEKKEQKKLFGRK